MQRNGGMFIPPFSFGCMCIIRLMSNTDLLFESEFNYRAYKTALETGLTSGQYYMLQEAGLGDIGQGILNYFKKKLGSDEKSAADTKKAKETLQKSIDKIVSEFPDKESGEKFVKALLKSYLETGKMPDLEKDSGDDSKGSGGSGQVKPGAAPSTDLKKAAASPAADTDTGAMVASLAGELSGVDGQQAVDKAKKDNVPFDKAYKALLNKVAEFSDEDVPTVKKVIDWLIDNDKIIPQTKVTFGESISLLDNLLEERWLKMAGVESSASKITEDVQDILDNLFEVELLDENEALTAYNREQRKAANPNKFQKSEKEGEAKKKQAQMASAADKEGRANKAKADKAKADAEKAKAGTDGNESEGKKAGNSNAGKKEKPGQEKASGKHATLSSLISKQIQLSPKVVGPVLDALVSKAKVKLAN